MNPVHVPEVVPGLDPVRAPVAVPVHQVVIVQTLQLAAALSVAPQMVMDCDSASFQAATG
jgi:hypothetical protein